MRKLKSTIGNIFVLMSFFLPFKGVCYNTTNHPHVMFKSLNKADVKIYGLNEVGKTETVQGWKVTGEIVDGTGMPLPNATVVEQGTSNGTIADFDGNFSLTVSDEDAVLIISYVGYLTQEVPVKGQENINVVLEEDAAMLDEVVVVGYGTQKRKDLTGSITSVDIEDMPPSANTNVVQALRGQTAGLNVEGGSLAGSEPNISIRGRTSLSASTSPLIVLDGVIYNGTLSPLRIQLFLFCFFIFTRSEDV
jgi:hypothetical protein